MRAAATLLALLAAACAAAEPGQPGSLSARLDGRVGAVAGAAGR